MTTTGRTRRNLTRLRLAPTTALIAVVMLVLLPLAVAEVVMGDAAVQLLVVASALLAVVAVCDAAVAMGQAGGVLPECRPLTRLSLDREASIDARLVVRGGKGSRGKLRVALEASASLGLSGRVVDVVFAADVEAVQISWKARPRRRGIYAPGTMLFERRSAFGLWCVHWMETLDGEIRVYPNVLGEGRRVAELFLRRPMQGWRTQRQVGRGRDFEKLREYLPGDSFDEIHWKATAKRRHPVTKVFQVERTQEVYAVVDASRLSGRAGGRGGDPRVDDTLLERQINAALALAVAAERQGDLFGLATYADTPRGFVRARNGAAHFQACRESMLRLRTGNVSPDFREVFTFLRARLTKRALLVFFASLDDPALAEAFTESVFLLARRHLVVVASPLPSDAVPLFAESPPADIERVYGHLAGHIRWQGLQDLGATLHRHGVQLAMLGRDDLAAGAVSQYMTLKQKQAI